MTVQTYVETGQNKQCVKSYTNGRYECSIITTQRDSNTTYAVLF